MLLSVCCGERESKKPDLFDYQWDDDEEEENNGKAHHHSSSTEDLILQHSRALKNSKLYQTHYRLANGDDYNDNLTAGRREAIIRRPTVCMTCQLDLCDTYQPPYFEKTPEEYKFIDEALGDNFIFSHLLSEDRQNFIYAMEQINVSKGTILIHQGDTTGNFFYILQSGIIQYLNADNVEFGQCHPGGSFGELSLLYDSPRAATCRTGEDSVLWKVDRTTFRHLLANRAHQNEQDVHKIIEKIEILKDLSASETRKLMENLTPVHYKKNERIVKKGDVGEVFYIIEHGCVKVHDIGLGQSRFVDEVILQPGDWFGEQSLLTGAPRDAHATAVTDDVRCLCLSREQFETTFGSLEERLKVGIRKKLLRTLPIFANSQFEKHEEDKLAAVMWEQCFRTGTYLSKAGEPYKQNLWIIEDGKVLVTNHKTGKIVKLTRGDYFGDKSIKNEDPNHISSHTAIVEENTTCFVLTRADLVDVIGDIHRLGEFVPFVPSKVNRSIKYKHLRKYRVLGKGGFGKVWLVSTENGKEPYALKQLDKRQLIVKNQVQSVMRERNIMYSIDHPFLLSLISSFQDEDYLYLLEELIQGGELFSVLYNSQRVNKMDGLPNGQAKFYSACIIQALGHLHQRNICYRDLKPENVLIDAKGYCVVVDMGFAKVVVDKTFTLCGTPEYLAPEIIMSRGHDKAVDYWSFGVLVYELLVGQSPFFVPNGDQRSLFKKIVMVKYEIPPSVNKDAKDLIERLLVRRQGGRLGNLSRGHRDITSHAWFKGVDFKKLTKKAIPAPWVPKIHDAFDSSHFDDFRKEETSTRFFRDKLDCTQQDLFKDF